MGGFSLWHWLVVGLVILLLFGKGRFSDLMGDVAKGLKSFKKGMTEDDETVPAPSQQRLSHGQPVDGQSVPPQPVTPPPGSTVPHRDLDPR